jgi:hypothetical protein
MNALARAYHRGVKLAPLVLLAVPLAVSANPRPMPEPPDLFAMDLGTHQRLEVGDANDRHDQWDKLDGVTIRLLVDHKVKWTKHGWHELTGLDDTAMPAAFRAKTCKLFDLHVFPQKLDTRDGVRMSLECKDRDMTHLDAVVVSTDILVDTADPWHVLHVGDGDADDSESACETSRGVSYALAGKTLTITTIETRGDKCTAAGTTKITKTVAI